MGVQDKAPVNWVRKRAECTVDDAFQALLSRVELDVTEINQFRNGAGP